MRKITVFLVVLGLLFFGCTETSECPTERNEVCGSDGVTYTNECYARQAGATVAYTGACTGAPGGGSASAVCADSDNGKNALEYGTATKGTESFNDTCSPASSSVFEYYCANNAITSETITCPAGTECNGGKCGEVLCSDTDNGQDTSVKGTAKKGGESSTDNCSSYSNVLEFYCSNNQILSKVIACASGKSCEGGACVVSACTDTDGGFNLYQKGSAKGTSGITYVDVCTGANSVTEYYCSDGNVFHTTADCGDTHMCSNGLCTTVTCRDTDAGQDEDTYGSVFTSSQEYKDSCHDEDTVSEYYCSGTSPLSKRIDCDADERCSGGECTSDYCTDTDGGKDKDEYGTVDVGGDGWSDYCYDGDTVTEYYCYEGDEEHTNMNCDSGEACSGGECVDESECSETDGGKDAYEKGTTTAGGDSETDYCVSEFVVREYFCTGDTMTSGSIECSSDEVCLSGECVEAKCSDSDGGKDYYEEGTVTKGQDSFTDYCDSRSEVMEYYCSSGDILTILHECGISGCDPGLNACIGIVR